MRIGKRKSISEGTKRRSTLSLESEKRRGHGRMALDEVGNLDMGQVIQGLRMYHNNVELYPKGNVDLSRSFKQGN